MQNPGATIPAAATKRTFSADAETLTWTRVDWASLALLGLGVVLAIARFWQPGVSSDADMLMGIYRVFELNQAWQNGVLFPRLGENLNFGYGAPLFQYYPPLVSYGALLFHKAGLGWIEASKAMFTVALLLASSGVYVYTRWLFRDRKAAFVSGAVYLFAPYLLTNIYERGAAAESLALAIVPWLFWSVHRLIAEDQRAWIWISSVLIALLVLAHNITALFVLPVLLASALLLTLALGRLNRLASLALAVGLGLGLSAFYWLPALAEISYVQVESTMVDDSKSVVAHLAPLREFVQTSLVFDYWGPMRFHPAYWQIALGALGVIGVAFQDRRLRLPLAFIAGLWIVTLVLQLTVSRPFWESLPLIRFIQFPWRLLGLASFSLAVLTGSLFLLGPLRRAPGWILAALLLGSMAILSTARLSPEQSPIWYPITSAEISKQDLFDRGSRGFALFSDYMPSAVQVSVTDMPRSRTPTASAQQPDHTAPLVQVTEASPSGVKLALSATQPFTLHLNRIFFPGWQAHVGSQAALVGAGGEMGLVSVSLPQGVYPLEIRFDDTPLRRIATVISLISWSILLLGVFRLLPRRGALLTASALAIAAATILLVRHNASEQSVRYPTHYPINFQNEIRLVGYDLEKTTWRAGENLNVDLYWLAQQTPSQDYRVFLHLAPTDDTGVVAQRDSMPQSGYGATTRWDPGELIVDEHSLHIGADVPPGSYYLLMGLYRPEPMQNLSIVQSPGVLPGDRAILAQLDIVN
jgi:hypothetical protein